MESPAPGECGRRREVGMGRFRTITLAAAFLIGGCAGAPLPSLPVSGTQARHVAPAKTQSLLYVGDPADGTVEVYAYAQHAHVQTLTGFESPAGLCADANGNVFVTDARARTVFEYAHGGTSPTQRSRRRFTRPTVVR